MSFCEWIWRGASLKSRSENVFCNVVVRSLGQRGSTHAVSWFTNTKCSLSGEAHAKNNKKHLPQPMQNLASATYANENRVFCEKTFANMGQLYLMKCIIDLHVQYLEHWNITICKNHQNHVPLTKSVHCPWNKERKGSKCFREADRVSHNSLFTKFSRQLCEKIPVYSLS